MVKILDDFFESLDEKLGDTRSDLDKMQDQAITEALEKGERTFVDPVTGLITNIDTFEGRDFAPSTPGGSLSELNFSPLQLGLGLLSPFFSVVNYASKGLLGSGIQDIDPLSFSVPMGSRDAFFGTKDFSLGPTGMETTTGPGLKDMQRPYTTPITGSNLAAPVDGTGGGNMTTDSGESYDAFDFY
jgi:hypothetical protein